MSQVKEIQVGITYTKNLGNFESLKLDAGIVVALAPGESTDDAYEAAWATVEKEIKERLAKVAAKRGL